MSHSGEQVYWQIFFGTAHQKMKPLMKNNIMEILSGFLKQENPFRS